MGTAFPGARQPASLSGSARDSLPLHGVPLRGDTRLRLVVPAKPPFVLDVDTGRVAPVRGVPTMRRGVVWVVGVGGRAGVVALEPEGRRAQLYAVRGIGPRVSRLGVGEEIVPAIDGRSVWVKRVVRDSRCTLRRVGLDGRMIRMPRAFPCSSTIGPGGSLGLAVSRLRVIDPETGRTVLTTPSGAFNSRLGIVAIAGRKALLTEGTGRDLTLLDAATGVQHRMPWPSAVGSLDQPAVDPRGRFVALSFGNPSRTSRAGQLFDAWVLDTETERLTQLPGMPAFVWLKSTNMAWTTDGRLVLLAKTSGKDMVAVWRAGQQRLAVKTVRLPDRSGSDSFAPIR